MKNESQTTIFNAFYKIIIEIVVKLHLFPKETSESVNFKVNQTKEISKISGKRVIHSMYIYQIKTKFVAYFYTKNYSLSLIKKIISFFFMFMFSNASM